MDFGVGNWERFWNWEALVRVEDVEELAEYLGMIEFEKELRIN